MNDHDEHDYEQYAGEEREYPTAAEETAYEIALDFADEERHAAEEAQVSSAEPDDDGDECHAEFIDGSWTYCGCDECDERETRDGNEVEPW
ncbi:hypothetical protein DT019_03300 [Streptomyces sp. SDr-06]|uniref:hypothetical protein n=1 Tax=Streptomyces sp. SDr-06 TaxID=2267702 RepID=UPI000DE9EBB4|nr:hypothetical protein [Streptomyces sp. SDr-06]RCH70530.1 hypothetical protein DT019_03300 [Streptomyces sp. SDr-06]